MKIVVNRCYGGFSLSEAVYNILGLKYDGYGYLSNKDLGIDDEYHFAYRSDPRLISAIEEVGIDDASGRLAELEIIEIPDGVKWEIGEYDGFESIDELHRSW